MSFAKRPKKEIDYSDSNMETPAKIGLTGLGVVVTAGGGLIGSNYAIEKTIQADLPQEASDEEWNKKLDVLLKKIIAGEEITKKIDNNPKKFELKNTTDGKKEFNDKDTARQTLKSWCGQWYKVTSEEETNALCKLPQKRGWLLGDKRS